ncbi:Cytoskeleton-associated protein 2 [Collichthys lucidus]|uniref:Cytoskeleton-associated protein 2 n=1 Tax=Collichthys lucidus TaxID=240159 RepID=A0A4U5V768_COLLU|nr:Cytoskeleton-associated protein 2 [Collichthys lucidus]
MDVTVSRRNHKKENKENAQPKSFIKREKPSAPSHLKSSKREETLAKNVLQAKARQADTRSTSSSDKPLKKIPATDKKVNRPVVSSTLSQYRLTTETAEERRAKLAQWQASKGKSFKRPAMTAAAPPKTKVCAKPKANLQPESQPAARRNPEPELSAETCKPASAAAAQGAESTTRSRTPAIMDTTVDLLSNSDADLPVDPQDRMDDIVVNLCDALEAMSTPSTCQDVLPQVTDVCSAVEVKESDPEDECRKEELKNETPEDVSEQPTVEQVKDEGEESESETEGDEDDEEEVDSDDCVMESKPQREEASVVKYSVKTTPYLQSIKKTIEDDVSASASRRKSNIKDLKFLTPVRRSSRIQRTSSRLPAMLMDHDPCVSSLAELVKMDDDPNAYIYRKNPALLEDLPDQPRL